jgi:hypothetical protein
MKCGRESGGLNARDQGICPAYTERKLHGVHGGSNGGRACWVIAGTYCGGKVQGTFAEKAKSCLVCDFYQLVRREARDEASGFRMTGELVAMIGEPRPA